MNKIERNANGLVDFWMTQMETLDERADLDIGDKIKLMATCGKEIRGVIASNIQYKKLVMSSPDIAKNAEIVLPVGTPPAQLAAS